MPTLDLTNWVGSKNSELDLDKKAREVGKELLRKNNEMQNVLKNMGTPEPSYLLSAEQRDSLVTVFALLETPGVDLSPLLQELVDLPELEDYFIKERPYGQSSETQT